MTHPINDVSDAPQPDKMKPTIGSRMMMHTQNIKKTGSNESISSVNHDPPANQVSDAPPLPNYMKPTISSRMMKHTQKPTHKEAKPLLKKSNLPDINPSKTCSSILKESNFPKQLKLHTGGGTKYEGTSVEHVCRYTRCSLNCNEHSPPPSTLQKYFSLLRSQTTKNVSSKEFSLFEKSGSQREEQKSNRENEESVTVSSISAIIAHTKKPSDDYFVEIYANRNGKVEMFSVNEKSGSVDLESNLVVVGKDGGDASVSNTDVLHTKSINSFDRSIESAELELSVENVHSEKDIPRCRENGFTIDLSEMNTGEDIEETRRDQSSKIVKDIAEEHVNKEDLMIDFSMHDDSKLPDDALKFSGDMLGRCSLGDIKWSSENKAEDFRANIPANNPVGTSNTFMSRILPLDIIDPSNISCEVGIIEENETVKNKVEEINTERAENELSERKCQHFEYETARNMTVRNDELHDPLSSEMENEAEDPTRFDRVKTSDKEIPEEYDSKVESKPQTISLDDEEQGENTTMLQSELCHQGAQCSNISNDMSMSNPFNDQVTREPMCIPREETREADLKSFLYDCEGKSKSGCSSVYDDDGVEFEQLLQDICSWYSNISAQQGESVEYSGDGHHGLPDILQENGIQFVMGEEYLTTVYKHLAGIATRSDQSLPETIRKIREAASTRKNGLNEDTHKLNIINRKPPNLLPRKPDPEAEKLELRYQEMDERKKADTWMLDSALQRIIANLSTSRKKKVSLLVEAFESVIPLPL